MYVCVYVCMYVCMCICVYYMYLSYVHTYVCACMCVSICMRVHLYVKDNQLEMSGNKTIMNVSLLIILFNKVIIVCIHIFILDVSVIL